MKDIKTIIEQCREMHNNCMGTMRLENQEPTGIDAEGIYDRLIIRESNKHINKNYIKRRIK